MRRIFFILSALLVVSVFSMSQEFRSQTKQPTRYFCGIGRVLSIDENKSGVTINHQTLEGYMPAMTMHFKAADPEVMGDVTAGDTVRFTLKDTPELTRLIYIEKIVSERSRRKKH